MKKKIQNKKIWLMWAGYIVLALALVALFFVPKYLESRNVSPDVCTVEGCREEESIEVHYARLSEKKYPSIDVINIEVTGEYLMWVINTEVTEVDPVEFELFLKHASQQIIIHHHEQGTLINYVSVFGVREMTQETYDSYAERYDDFTQAYPTLDGVYCIRVVVLYPRDLILTCDNCEEWLTYQGLEWENYDCVPLLQEKVVWPGIGVP